MGGVGGGKWPGNHRRCNLSGMCANELYVDTGVCVRVCAPAGGAV